MKKIAFALALAGIVSINLAKASDDCVDCKSQGKNRITHNQVVRTTGKGFGRLFYYPTHNKLTKVTRINDGNDRHAN